MPVLQNPKHERFAQLAALGNSDTAAYRKAFKCKQSTAETNAYRLREIEGVAERIADLQEMAAAKTVMSLTEKRQYLADIVRACPSEIDGDSPLCQGVEYTVSGGVRGRLRRGNADRGNEETEPEVKTVRVKLPDKLKAIELDAKLAGELKGDNGTQVSLTVVVSHADVLARVRAMSPVLAALSRAGKN